MKIPKVANNHPQRVYVERTPFWAGHSDYGDARVAARSQDGRTAGETGDRQVILEAWQWITYTFRTIKSASSLMQLHRKNPAISSESPKAPSSILSPNSLHNVLYASNSKNPTLLHPTLHLQSRNIRYQSQVKPSHKPLEAEISAKTLSWRPHSQSVQPQGLTSWRKADEKKSAKFAHTIFWIP